MELALQSSHELDGLSRWWRWPKKIQDSWLLAHDWDS